MEKVLKVFTYINSELKKPFPNEKEQIEISAFVYSAKRMGAAPSISATIKHAQCLDELWTGAEYVEFRGEKYFLRSTPTSSYDNTDVRYKHECYFQSERILLENVYYYDVVSTNNNDDKPTSNNTNFSFFGTIFEFVKRINSSLKHSGITGYNIVVDEDVEEDEKNLIPKSVSFQNQFIGNVIQEIYNTYKIPYYFVGKTIHVGFHEKRVPTKLKYGINDSLLSITKTNANNKIVNRITATGSTENIPYYYPNESSKGKLGVIVEKGDIVAQIVNPEIFAQTVSTTEKLVYSKNDGLLETALDSLLVRKLSKNNSAIETIVSSSDPSKIEYKGVSVQDGDYVNIIARARFGAWSEGSYSFEVKKGTADSVDNVAKIYKIEISTIYDDSISDSVETVFDDGDGVTDQSITVDFDFKHALIGNVRFFEVSVYMNQTPNSGTKELSYSNTLSFVGKDTSLVWKNESRSTKKKDISDYGLSISGTPSIGDTIGQKIIEYITPQPTLMPPLYRNTEGRERFYNAVNGTYEGFHFDNPFIEGRPSEYIVNLDHIKPTIEGMEVNGLRIDMFSEFAYDDNDNDEFVSDGGTSEKLLHPYFFGKLRKMDFNLFDHAIESGEMTVSMTSGACASCNFVIQVDSPETQKNSVQVNSDGTLKKDEGGNVVFGKPQDQQNDTINNEVWIALKKEQSTFGIVMPNASASYKPKASSTSNNNDGDTFVFLNINLPQEYIYAAERKLEHEMLTYMSQNNSEKFNFSIKFSRIFLEENQDVFENLTENSTVTVEYNGNDYGLYVSSYTYRMNNGDILPEIVVELFDTLAITQNVIQKAVSEVKSDLLSVSTVVDAYKSSMSKSIRKDKSDSTPFKLTTGDMLVKKRMPTGFSEESGGNLDVEGSATVFGDELVQGNFTTQLNASIKGGLSVGRSVTIKENATVGGDFEASKNAEIKQKASIGGNATLKGDSNKIFGDVTFGKEGTKTEYTEGVKGCKIYFNGSGWAIDTDYLSVNKRMYAKSIQVDEVDHVGGQIILTDASCVADKVEDKEEYYRVYFRAKNGEGRKVYNQWRVGDQAYCQIFNIDKGDTEDTEDTEDFTNRYYWRLVVGIGSGDEFHYIDLSKRYYDISGDLKMDNNAGTTPMPDDPIVQLGYRAQSGDDAEFVKQRQGATMISGGGRQGRSIRMWEKIDSFILPEPRVLISPSNVEMTLNKLHIKTTGDEEEVKDVIDYVQEFQEQFHIFELDTSEIPTLENEPYITWTEEEKVRYSTPPNNAVVINADGLTWRFVVTDGVYSFEEFTDPWLLAQHKDLQTILDDNVIAADELITLIRLKTELEKERVEVEGEKYAAKVDVTAAYNEWKDAFDVLKTVVDDLTEMNPPILLDGYKGELNGASSTHSREELSGAFNNHTVALYKWQAALRDAGLDKVGGDIEQAAQDIDNIMSDDVVTDDEVSRIITIKGEVVSEYAIAVSQKTVLSNKQYAKVSEIFDSMEDAYNALVAMFDAILDAETPIHLGTDVDYTREGINTLYSNYAAGIYEWQSAYQKLFSDEALKELDDILDDNVITADEMLVFARLNNTLSSEKGSVTSQYNDAVAKAIIDTTPLISAYNNYITAVNGLMTTLTGLINLDTPVYLKDYTGGKEGGSSTDVSRADIEEIVAFHSSAYQKWVYIVADFNNEGNSVLLEEILSDNIISANEKPTFIEMGKRIAQESVQEKNKYQAVTSPSTVLTNAYTNYTSAMTTLMTVLANIKNLTPPIHLKTDTEAGDIAYTRDELQALVVTYDVRLAAWRDAYEDFRRDKSSIDTLQDAKDYADEKIADITSGTIDEHINGLISGYVDGKFTETNSKIKATKDSVKAVTDWIGEDAIGSTGMITYLNGLFVGTSTIELDAEGNITNYSKAGLVTTTNFASVFAEETGKDGKKVSAIISAFVDEGVSNITLTADKIFIESGSPAFDNYFRLENGNVTMQDLYCRNITVEGVINNLIDTITLYSLGKGSYNEATDTFFLDPLKCGSVVRLPAYTDISKIILPIAYNDGDDNTIIEGAKSGFSIGVMEPYHHHSLDELRQCVGKKLWILNETGDKVIIQTGGEGSTEGSSFLMIRTTYANGNLDMKYWSAGPHAISEEVTMASNTDNSSGAAGYNYVLECKMGMFNNRECIYWELTSLFPSLQ